VQHILAPFHSRKKVLFVCRENACRSQMASALTQFMAGDKLEVFSGGSKPAEKVHPDMVTVMHEKGIDMGFRVPKTIDEVLRSETPEVIITMGCAEECPLVPGARKIDWDLPDPAGKPLEFMRDIRDEIENRVQKLIGEIS
jgi:arsenate reductase